MIPARTNITINQLRAEGLFPDLDAPEISRNGNVLYEQQYQMTGSWQVVIENPNSTGIIYYTLNGRDPRIVEGDGEITLNLQGSAIVKTRIFDNGEWSAIRHIDFLSGSDDLSNLKITEIHYHPLDLIVGNDTTSGKDFEFMEFKNIGETSLNLSGIIVDSAVNYTFPAHTLIAPGSFYVITSKPSKFYEMSGKISSDNFQGNLSNSGERILVKSSTGEELMNFIYYDSMPWPERPDGDGPSLVSAEFNPTGDPGSPEYWRASYHDGGSPFADDLLFPQLDDPETTDGIMFSFRVYPNPTHGELTLEVATELYDRPVYARLYTLSGELVYESAFHNKTSFNFQAIKMRPGIYILSVRSGDWIRNEKVVFNP